MAIIMFFCNQTTNRAHFSNHKNSTCIFQLRLTVYDTGYPDQIATATAEVTISRNEFAPVFTESPYRVTVNETIDVGKGILTVSATDKDGVSFDIGPLIYHRLTEERLECWKDVISFPFLCPTFRGLTYVHALLVNGPRDMVSVFENVNFYRLKENLSLFSFFSVCITLLHIITWI